MMTKQTAYHHLQQADALLHEADQTDPHVVRAHRLVHQAAAHLSESSEIREQAAGVNADVAPTPENLGEASRQPTAHGAGIRAEMVHLAACVILQVEALDRRAAERGDVR